MRCEARSSGWSRDLNQRQVDAHPCKRTGTREFEGRKLCPAHEKQAKLRREKAAALKGLLLQQLISNEPFAAVSELALDGLAEFLAPFLANDFWLQLERSKRA